MQSVKITVNEIMCGFDKKISSNSILFRVLIATQISVADLLDNIVDQTSATIEFLC